MELSFDDTTEPMVSVIMPMYNSARFIKEAIGSVVAQTYQNWELLIVDDGSTDGSIEIVERYAGNDSRIRLLINNDHTGLPSAPRNYGIRNAKGQFIAFLDSDDLWLPYKLERQLSFFNSDNVAIVFSNYEKIDEEGNRENRVVVSPMRVTYHDMLYSNYIGNLTGIYNRKVTGTQYLPDIHHEDYALWLHILRKGFKAVNTGTIEGLYRIRNKSISSSKWHLLPWQWNIYRRQEHIPVFHAIYYYICYAYNGWRKSRI